jgi:hypothetical protein
MGNPSSSLSPLNPSHPINQNDSRKSNTDGINFDNIHCNDGDDIFNVLDKMYSDDYSEKEKNIIAIKFIFKMLFLFWFLFL